MLVDLGHQTRLAVVLVFVLAFVLAFGLGAGLSGGLILGLVVVLIMGLILGLVAGGDSRFILGQVVFGGIGTFVRHFALRKLLAHYDYLPWRLVPFLEYARERLLLRRVGGGYIFIHRTLQEYFASQDTSFGQRGSQPPICKLDFYAE